MSLRRFALGAALALACAFSIAACGEKRNDGTSPAGVASLPALSIKEDTPNLLLTWVDSHGETHSALHPSEVPVEGKGLVRVVVSDREEGTRDPLYVVDLTQVSGDGGWTARVMTRREWESVLEKRREAYLGKLTPKTAPPASGGPAPSAAQTAPSSSAAAAGVMVTIYGASWCKPCHQAADYLKSIGVPVIVKDVEESPEAAAEMRQKLEKSGQRGGSIPVIDVRGQILVGYSRRELDRALAKAASSTVL